MRTRLRIDDRDTWASERHRRGTIERRKCLNDDLAIIIEFANLHLYAVTDGRDGCPILNFIDSISRPRSIQHEDTSVVAGNVA